MQIKCEYCGSMIDEAATKCPYCGATNQSVKRSADHTPKTIAELQQWYQDRHLPPYETTRFFIGINYTKPKAFGIYQDGDQFIVFKNKANGERAIRYKGTDEAYAVNELYLKLKDEILNQKALNQQKKQYSASSKAKKKHSVKDFFKSVGLFFCIIIPIGLIVFIDSMVKGFGAALFSSIFVAIGLLVYRSIIIMVLPIIITMTQSMPTRVTAGLNTMMILTTEITIKSIVPVSRQTYYPTNLITDLTSTTIPNGPLR